MHGSSDAATHEEYIDALPEPRRSDIRRLHELIRATVPQLEPTMAFHILGYGTYHHRYASGREGEAALVSVANNKRYISLYVCAVRDGHYLAETFAPKLGTVSSGRSCIRFRRLEELDLDALRDLLRESVAHPPGELSPAGDTR
jgi:hypothetical protein